MVFVSLCNQTDHFPPFAFVIVFSFCFICCQAWVLACADWLLALLKWISHSDRCGCWATLRNLAPALVEALQPNAELVFPWTLPLPPIPFLLKVVLPMEKQTPKTLCVVVVCVYVCVLLVGWFREAYLNFRADWIPVRWGSRPLNSSFLSRPYPPMYFAKACRSLFIIFLGCVAIWWWCIVLVKNRRNTDSRAQSRRWLLD